LIKTDNAERSTRHWSRRNHRVTDTFCNCINAPILLYYVSQIPVLILNFRRDLKYGSNQYLTKIESSPTQLQCSSLPEIYFQHFQTPNQPVFKNFWIRIRCGSQIFEIWEFDSCSKYGTIDATKIQQGFYFRNVVLTFVTEVTGVTFSVLDSAPVPKFFGSDSGSGEFSNSGIRFLFRLRLPSSIQPKVTHVFTSEMTTQTRHEHWTGLGLD